MTTARSSPAAWRPKRARRSRTSTKTLEASGAKLSDIIKITAFITDLDAYPEYAKVRLELFGDHLPSSATVQVAGLLVGAQIEIDAIAFVPEG